MNEFTIRESTRARHVKLQVSPYEGLTVVVPKGFNRKKIPAILNEKKKWIHNALGKMGDLRHAHTLGLPESIGLTALNQEFSVSYNKQEAKKVTLVQQENALVINGTATDDDYRLHLKKWLHKTAKENFSLRCDQLSRLYGLPFNKTTIRNQKTRWGSCSQRKTISLNQKLLFLPVELAEYVIIHELCHTKHLNHSGRFWRLVEACCPDYTEMEKDLRTAWRYVPAWAI